MKPKRKMRLPNPLAAISSRLEPSRRDKLEKAMTVTAGTAAAIWVVLRLKRDLYGPGGSRMSRYNNTVDEVWAEQRASEQPDD